MTFAHGSRSTRGLAKRLVAAGCDKKLAESLVRALGAQGQAVISSTREHVLNVITVIDEMETLEYCATQARNRAPRIRADPCSRRPLCLTGVPRVTTRCSPIPLPGRAYTVRAI